MDWDRDVFEDSIVDAMAKARPVRDQGQGQAT